MKPLSRRSLQFVIATQAGFLLAAAGVIYSQQTTTQRFPPFDNEDVKVWRSVVLPNQPLTMHRHEHPRVIIPLHGGLMKIVDQSGAIESHQWDTGKAYWLPANPPNPTHADVNDGTEPMDCRGGDRQE